MDLEALRHSCSHIMAQAVKRLFADAKLGIGPCIEDGFYYDFDIPQGLKEEDIPGIEDEMRKIIEQNFPFLQEFWPKEKAEKFFAEKGEIYKVELLKEIPDKEVSIFKDGEFIDLCKGPHIDSTGQIKFFKLLSIAGAYWRGKETNPMLTRIYGTAFPSSEELKEYLKNISEALKRDHRILGRRLELFDIYYDEAGAGFVFWKPKGAILRRTIEDWLIKEHLKRGYLLLNTPHLLKAELWKQSGHMDYYRELMFIVEGQTQNFIVKPMNCPGHILIYKARIRSYKDLPLRFFELGTVYRYEKSGVLHGLLRVRGFTQDDAHIFLPEEQIEEEIINIIEFVKSGLKRFGFEDFEVELSTQPGEFIGTQSMWDKATTSLKQALKRLSLEYKINPGEGAFYGPKIDIKIKDCLRRSWQASTIQVDFALPERFNLSFINEKDQKERPVMIHRVILGSIERFIGALIEHHQGLFPLWLAPLQVIILPLKESLNKYAFKLRDLLEKEGIRVEVDSRNERLNRKIREAEEKMIPYICVVGEDERREDSLDVRKKREGRIGKKSINEFLSLLKKEVAY